ncbi:hypothetical protein [Pedobacter gandavensis]|uniref:hypothetical protein n=1 Tax=Pedobacter gandavensis TaxID=2679963 RepID=UPI00292E0E49|nr:hypothetical protein [Pedobacter gandavensis]
MKKMKLAYLLAIILAFCSCKKMNSVTPIVEQKLMVSDFVGAGGAAFKDGVGDGAAFNLPNSMTIDATGNLFVADNNNLRIRKVTPDGTVSTFAGNGIQGYLDGTGTTAKFGYNTSISIDAQNNLYVADPENSCIRKITPTGVVSTLVGAPGRSNLDGPIATAGVSFRNIPDLTVDGLNNVYFIDNKGIRKVGINGIVSTVVKIGSSNITGPIATSAINNPLHITSDKNGNVFVSSLSQSNLLIFKISIDGVLSRYAGAPDGEVGYQLGISDVARFTRTRSLTSDKLGNIFITDNNHVVVKITTDGYVRHVAGIQYTGVYLPFVPGSAMTATLPDIIDVAIDPNNGTLYVLEESPSSICKIALIDKPTTPPTQTEIDKANWNKPTGWK